MTEKRYIKLLLWSVGLGEMDKCEKAADALIAKGYRKQSEGEWLPTKERLCAIKCGYCGETIDLDDGDDYLYWNFCPYCGAKMKVGAE